MSGRQLSICKSCLPLQNGNMMFHLYPFIINDIKLMLDNTLVLEKDTLQKLKEK